jgi:hypothetical protein
MTNPFLNAVPVKRLRASRCEKRLSRESRGVTIAELRAPGENCIFFGQAPPRAGPALKAATID